MNAVAAPGMANLSTAPIADIVKAAWETGQTIDLSGIGYGRIHWGNRQDVRDEPSPYYYFLAGLVRHFGLQRVLEIGTHWGGATRAMWIGAQDKDRCEITTVDISTESDNRLKDYPKIRKIVGDGNSAQVFERICSEFDNQIDLLFIDTEHQTMPTYTSFALYGMALRPKLIVLDDITLNDKMLAAWNYTRRSFPEGDSINAAEVIPAIRPSADKPGFGVIRLAHNI